MRIKEILSQHRRDLQCIYICEHCEFERKGYWYDDDNYHYNVVPFMICEKCNKKSKNYIPLKPKYEDHVVI